MKKDERVDITGKQFGRWTVIGFSISKNRKSYWLCRCSCGKEKVVYGGSLKRYLSQSCGCIQREKPANFQHGLSYTRFHRIWAGVKNRCLNKEQINYKRYGGRGIKICKKWLKFDNFKNDMYPSYTNHVLLHGEQNTTIDRKNNGGNYNKKNCKWATLKEQGQNKRNNI